MICKEMERAGRHRGNLYEGHYGFRCADAHGFCIRCLSTGFTAKSRADLKKHHDSDCYIKPGTKKYTYLQKDCLQHSWICIKHNKANVPLYEAHMQEFLNKKQNITFSHVCIAQISHPTGPPKASDMQMATEHQFGHGPPNTSNPRQRLPRTPESHGLLEMLHSNLPRTLMAKPLYPRGSALPHLCHSLAQLLRPTRTLQFLPLRKTSLRLG